MQYNKKTILASTLVASTSMAAYVSSDSWTTLTPTATYSGAITDYNTSFGIAVEPITTGSYASYYSTSATANTTTAANAKRAEAISQISDGQIQATTSTTKTSSTTKSTAAAVSQISDGQIQATTSTTKASSTADAVSQISDGQIQATTSTTASTSSTASAASQISDGQVQASTTTASSDASSEASSTASSTSSATSTGSPVDAVSCKNNGTLAMLLNDGILTDEAGRIGSIVANRQFQFDGPPPQAGAIYADGWGITPEGNLAIGDEDVFWQCLSGTFYNLYDMSIGGQCKPVHLEVVELITC